jgi:hypothetical protein
MPAGPAVRGPAIRGLAIQGPAVFCATAPVPPLH